MDIEKIVTQLVKDELTFDTTKNYVKIIRENPLISKNILLKEFKNNVTIKDTMYHYDVLLYLLSELEVDGCVHLLVDFLKNDQEKLEDCVFYEFEFEKIFFSLVKNPEDRKYFFDSFINFHTGIQSFIIEVSFNKLLKYKIVEKKTLDNICEELLNKIINSDDSIKFSTNKNNIFDISKYDMLISSIMEYYVTEKMIEKLPIIKELFDKNIAHKKILGNYEEVENMMLEKKTKKENITKKLTQNQKKKLKKKEKAKALKQASIQIQGEIQKEKSEESKIDNSVREPNVNELKVDIINIFSKYDCYR